MSIDYQKLNNKTYDSSAKLMAEYFAGIGARTEDIERALVLAGSPKKARVIEIGCGDGRDAAEIVQRVTFYKGFDPSMGMLEIAKQKLPDELFVQATANTFSYPQGNVDVVYAFASILHVPRGRLGDVFEKVRNALRPEGIFYISTKESVYYKKEVKKDRFGERLFYYYNVGILEEIAGKAFEKVYEDHQLIGHTGWLTLALKAK